MKLGMVTDSLADLTLAEAAKVCRGLGLEQVELGCGNWSPAPHVNLDALTEFKRGSNGVVELKFTDRARLLERLLDAADHSGEDQVDRFLSAMERQEEGK